MSTSWPSRQPSRDRDPRGGRRGDQIAKYGVLVMSAVLTAAMAWLLMQLPEALAAGARAETVRAETMDQKIRDACEQRGFGPRTHEHTLCTMDLRAQRRTDRLSILTAGSAVYW